MCTEYVFCKLNGLNFLKLAYFFIKRNSCIVSSARKSEVLYSVQYALFFFFPAACRNSSPSPIARTCQAAQPDFSKLPASIPTKGKDWPTRLDFFYYTYNCRIHKSLRGHSPIEAFLWRPNFSLHA